MNLKLATAQIRPYAKRMTASKSFKLSIAFFFALMLIIPTTFQAERGVLLAVICVGAIYAAGGGGWRVTHDLLAFWLLSLILGATGILQGFAHGTPGALPVVTVFLAWPIVYMLFVGLVHSPVTIVTLEKTLVLGIFVAASMLIVLFVGAISGHGDYVSGVFAFLGAHYGVYSGYTELTAYNLTTVMYGLPFLTTLLAFPRHRGWAGSRWRIGCVLALVLLVCIVSGRRAFWTLAALTPLLMAGLFAVCGIRVRTRYVVAGALLVVVVLCAAVSLWGFTFGGLMQRLSAGFDFDSANLRTQQFVALMSAWRESPVFGHGLGAAVSVIRSQDMVWAYELTYVALLFQVGLVGFIGYTLAVLWIFYAGIRIVRANRDAASVILPLLVALAGFLFMTASNPYLTKFDYLWTIFLPVAAINAYRTMR